MIETMIHQTPNHPTEVKVGGLTRRSLLLSLPALSLARRLMAQERPNVLRIRALHQVTLAVSNLQRSLDFYRKLFGMPVQARNDGAILLRIGTGPGFLKLIEAGSAPPRIDHFGVAVDGFDVDEVMRTLANHGIAPTGGGEGSSVGAMPVRLARRASTPEIHMGDLDGLVIQLQDPRYCGGAGSLGDACADPELAPSPGALSPVELNHFTINVPDPERANAFYRELFGLEVQVMQAAAAALGVGTGGQFLMFVNGDRARINHVCLAVEDFSVNGIQRSLEDNGIRPRSGGPETSGPLQHWVSMRMPNRGGAPEGTPELYFSDPDGLRVQLQDQTYCGGGGYLGGVCP